MIWCFALGLFLLYKPLIAQTQRDTLRLGTLSLDPKDKKSFSGRDSSLVLYIDTLLMKDRSSINFYGKKKVTLYIQYAEFSKDALIRGTDGKNNGTDIDLYVNIGKLGNLIVDAAGLDAFNGTKTYPNGDGGTIHVYYLGSGIVPQSDAPKAPGHLLMLVQAGGHRVNAQSEVGNILDRIGSGSRPLGQLPQGQVYSGSPGTDGKATVEAVAEIP